MNGNMIFFFFSSRRRHTRWNCDWSSDVCSSDCSFRILQPRNEGTKGWNGRQNFVPWFLRCSIIFSWQKQRALTVAQAFQPAGSGDFPVARSRWSLIRFDSQQPEGLPEISRGLSGSDTPGKCRTNIRTPAGCQNWEQVLLTFISL